MFHLAEVAEKFPGHLRELLESVLQGGVVEKGHFTGVDACYFRIYSGTPTLEFRDARVLVLVGALIDLPQQLEQREQARFGSYEGSSGQGNQPANGLFGSRRQVEMRLVRIFGVVLSKPAVFRICPVIKVLGRGLREGLGAQAFAQYEQLVLQCFGEVALRCCASVRFQEIALQKTRHQRRVVRAQQAPSRVALAHAVEGVVIEIHERWVRL